MSMILPTPIPGGLPGGGAFASITVGDRDLDGVNVVVDYNNAAIKGHVEVETGTPKDGLFCAGLPFRRSREVDHAPAR
jgi:hypothetical protein